MKIFPIEYPGRRLSLEPYNRHAASLHHVLQNVFGDATVALDLFTSANISFAEPDESATIESLYAQHVERYEKDSKLELEITPIVLRENGVDENLFSLDYSVRKLNPDVSSEERIRLRNEINYRVSVKKRVEEWEKKSTPNIFENKKVFLHAQSFLYALDVFRKTLVRLNEITSSLGVSLGKDIQDFDSHFPSLIHIRNSAYHIEDRVLFENKNRKPIGFPDNSNHTLFLNNLNGTKYGFTLGNDGSYGEIDVSADSLEKVQAIFQSIVNTLPWDDARNRYLGHNKYLWPYTG